MVIIIKKLLYVLYCTKNGYGMQVPVSIPYSETLVYSESTCRSRISLRSERIDENTERSKTLSKQSNNIGRENFSKIERRTDGGYSTMIMSAILINKYNNIRKSSSICTMQSMDIP